MERTTPYTINLYGDQCSAGAGIVALLPLLYHKISSMARKRDVLLRVFITVLPKNQDTGFLIFSSQYVV